MTVMIRSTPDIKAIALDLEGTLITNAVSILPRPGLYDFLEFCRQTFEMVTVFTAVTRSRVEAIIRLLVEEGSVPGWTAEIPIVDWEGRLKDLCFIEGFEPREILIVDDQAGYIVPEQTSQWIPIREYSMLYPEDDGELLRIRQVIEQKRLG